MAGYIGSKAAVVSSGAERKKVFTATSGQTSFTGLSYTVNNVHVFQNGVRLVDGTDYTAADGNSLTLTVGAATDDQVVVVSYNTFQTSDTVSASAGGTFTGDVNFTGAFTSRGIDDNATSTAMTLDGSGNLLVGKTAADGATDGGEIRAGGTLVNTTNNSTTAYFNRRTSDGDLISFQKDGSTVGSIGVATAGVSDENLYIANGDTGLRFRYNDDSIIPSNNTGSFRDNAIDLGLSNARFKDLYLSGGVFLGGTGAANKLDDYEEGTWAPAITAGSGGSSIVSGTNTATYTKIGRLVFCQIRTNCSSSSTSRLHISSLPFTSVGGNAQLGVMSKHGTNGGSFYALSAGEFAAYSYDGGIFTAADANGVFRASFTYHTS